MPTLKIARIMQFLSESSIKNFARNSSEPSTSDVQMLGSKLKEVLGAVRSDSNVNDTAFYHIAPDLVREVGLEKESAIYKGLAQMGNVERLIEIAKGFLPADLVTDIPGDILSLVLNEMTLTQKAELIFSQDKERRKLLMSLAGSGRSLEIIEQELESIAGDASKAKTIQRNGSKMWETFVLGVRQVVQDNRDISDEILPMIRDWAESQVRSEKGGASAA